MLSKKQEARSKEGDDMNKAIIDMRRWIGLVLTVAGLTIGFVIPVCNPSIAMTSMQTDPRLLYSTYLGGDGDDMVSGIAVDRMGNIYITGWTDSTDFPTRNPIRANRGGGMDAFVAKIDPSRSGADALIYSTYLGGGGDEFARDIAVDNAGNAYVVGRTNSTNFPKLNAFQDTLAGGFDAFVAKLDPAGRLVYSTYLGGGGDAGRTTGDDFGNGIALDAEGLVYVVGRTDSLDFPTRRSRQSLPLGGFDAFLTKLDLTKRGSSALLYSTYLGDTSDDAFTDVAVDASGFAYVTGNTSSPSFPNKDGWQRTLAGFFDAVLVKFDPSKSGPTSLIYSTYLGGEMLDTGQRVGVDMAGNVYVVGETQSANFPTRNALQTGFGGFLDGFVAKFNARGDLIYSTYVGRGGQDQVFDIAVDASGLASVTGRTSSADLMLRNPLQAMFLGGTDAFVATFDFAQAGASAMLFSSYLGGYLGDGGFSVARDGAGKVYVAGGTDSPNFPTQNPIQADVAGGVRDVFVTVIGSGR
jgi:hypothetical protein